ncbi:hypothetical protein WISP_94736 [Willisornis vidua]|uniref:Uncharacterized protein n=1 Tax=Willisornis vidua TaxID=1566151 RepID=A0ABQ9D5T1_9PASS|nr:hypothetical protein WISP_94736 [Willisornis vidua]
MVKSLERKPYEKLVEGTWSAQPGEVKDIAGVIIPNQSNMKYKPLMPTNPYCHRPGSPTVSTSSDPEHFSSLKFAKITLICKVLERLVNVLVWE